MRRALRRGIDCGGEAGRTGADDRDVEHVVRVESLGQPERIGEGGVARVAQRLLLARHDDHRELVGAEFEAVEEAAGIRIRLGIEKAVRIAVARQEPLQPQRVAAMTRADQHHPAMHVPNEADAPQDEGAHDDLADIRLAGDQPAEIGAPHAHDPAVDADAAGNEDLAIVEQVEFARELAVGVHREDVFRAVLVVVEDLDRALDHEEEIDASLAPLEDRRAFRQALLGAVGGDPRRHLLAEPREGLRLAQVGIVRVETRPGADGGWSGHAHRVRKAARRRNGLGSTGAARRGSADKRSGALRPASSVFDETDAGRSAVGTRKERHAVETA
ncbi:MAG TPA: hypothetical protein VGD08_16735 [Stellaceae bacterium]